MLKPISSKLIPGSVVLLAAVFSVILATPGALADTSAGRTVTYSQQDIVQIRAKVRFSTLIVLPENEEILDFTTGDKEFWIINGAHNLCYVHPAKTGIHSNLNLITSSGHVYSFLLNEVSNDPKTQPDLKLFVELKDGSAITTGIDSRGYVRAAEAEAYKKELEAVRSQTDQQLRAAQAQASEEISKFRTDYQSTLQFDYTFTPQASREPFLISAIYHDAAFTYIKCAAREKPTLYEIKDGKPNLINFQLESGVYIAPKILDSGYLAIGTKKVTFSRQLSGK